MVYKLSRIVDDFIEFLFCKPVDFSTFLAINEFLIILHSWNMRFPGWIFKISENNA